MGFEMKIIHLRFDLSCLQCVLLKKRKLEERRTREREKYETCYSFNSFILLIHCSVLPVFSNYGIFSRKDSKNGFQKSFEVTINIFWNRRTNNLHSLFQGMESPFKEALDHYNRRRSSRERANQHFKNWLQFATPSKIHPYPR